MRFVCSPESVSFEAEFSNIWILSTQNSCVSFKFLNTFEKNYTILLFLGLATYAFNISMDLKYMWIFDRKKYIIVINE